MMIRKLFVCIALWTAAAAAPAAAQPDGRLGLGVVGGNPTGGTLKYWLDNRMAFDFGVGVSEDAVIWGDMMLHAWDLLPQPRTGVLGAYASFGPRIETDRDTEFGLRTLLGLTYLFAGKRAEAFVELGPVFQVEPDGEVDLDGGIGIRFYFGK